MIVCILDAVRTLIPSKASVWILNKFCPFHIKNYVGADLFDWACIEWEGFTSTTLVLILHVANIISSWNIIRSEHLHFVFLNTREFGIYLHCTVASSWKTFPYLHRLRQIYINPTKYGREQALRSIDAWKTMLWIDANKLDIRRTQVLTNLFKDTMSLRNDLKHVCPCLPWRRIANRILR